MCAQRLIDVVENFHIRDIGKIVHSEQVFTAPKSFLRQRDGAVLFIDLIIDVAAEFRDDLVETVVLVGRFLARPGDNQRCSRFVDENRVDFVHDCILMGALNAMRQIELHVVAQIVETELVVGSIRDIGTVGFPPFIVVQAVLDNPNGESQKFVQASHPLGVAPGQIIVDRYDVNPFAFQGIQICGKRCDQRLTFTCLHFRNAALMQHNSTDKLHVEMPHVERALACFTHDGEGIRQQVFEGFPVFEALFEFGCLGFELFVGEARKSRL